MQQQDNDFDMDKNPFVTTSSGNTPKLETFIAATYTAMPQIKYESNLSRNNPLLTPFTAVVPNIKYEYIPKMQPESSNTAVVPNNSIVKEEFFIQGPIQNIIETAVKIILDKIKVPNAPMPPSLREIDQLDQLLV